MEQRTPEWFAKRLGKVTASRIADLMARTKSGPAASRANYMAQLVTERLTGRPTEGYESPAMAWGTESMTKPSIEGDMRAIQKAYDKLNGRKVTFISAHGTATPTGDMVELQAIKNVFGDELKDIPITSTKALHGHTLGASGIIESMGCIAVLQEDKVIPNWHLGEQDDKVPEGTYLPVVE